MNTYILVCLYLCLPACLSAQVIALHDKYLAYVGTCFANSSLFHKALKEAFEGFCNKNVAGSTSAELMANFCDNILKKVRRPDVGTREQHSVLGFACSKATCGGLQQRTFSRST